MKITKAKKPLIGRKVMIRTVPCAQIYRERLGKSSSGAIKQPGIAPYVRYLVCTLILRCHVSRVRRRRKMGYDSLLVAYKSLSSPNRP